MLRPGPMVVDRVIFCRYTPFAEAGLAFLRSSSKRFEIFPDPVSIETDLTYAAVNDARLVGTELNLSCFGIVHRCFHIRGYRAGFRVRHQSTGTENLAKLADQTHRIGRGDEHVEIQLTPLILSARSSKPTRSAPAAVALSALSP